MRTGLVIDSACDLPHWFIEQNNIGVLPISIHIEDETFVDDRDPGRTINFYDSDLIDKSHAAESAPYSADQIRDFFLDRVVVDYDYAVIETITKSRSLIFDNAQNAARGILSAYRPIRQQAGIDDPFAMRVINTRTLFAGQGVLAAHTIRMIQDGAKLSDIRRSIERLTRYVYAYAVPQDLSYLRERARKKGDSSVSWASAMLGRALDIKPIVAGRDDDTYPVAKVRGFETAVHRLFTYACRRMQVGLLSPYVCVSYAGDPAEVEEMPGYEEFVRTAESHEVTPLVSVMSTTGGVNLGPGTFSIALLAEPHEFA